MSSYFDRNESYSENGLPPPPGSGTEATQGRPESNFRGLSDAQKWRKEDWMKKGALALIFRAVALLFSFLTFMLVVTITGFTQLSDLCYVFSIALFVMIYTAVVVGIKGHELRTGDVVIPENIVAWIHFIGDQCLALLLLSSASSVTSMVRGLGNAAGYQVYDQGKGIAAMAILCFFSLESAALISGYHFAIHLFTS